MFGSLSKSFAYRWGSLVLGHSFGVPERIGAILVILGGLGSILGFIPDLDELQRWAIRISALAFIAVFIYRLFMAPYWIHLEDAKLLEDERKRKDEAVLALQNLKAERDNRLGVQMHDERTRYVETVKQHVEHLKSQRKILEAGQETLRRRLDDESKKRRREWADAIAALVIEGKNILDDWISGTTEYEAERWSMKVYNYLVIHVGDPYPRKFILAQRPSQSSHKLNETSLRFRLDTLQRFIPEIMRGEAQGKGGYRP
jgi:hypothetical protein